MSCAVMISPMVLMRRMSNATKMIERETEGDIEAVVDSRRDF